MIFVALVTMSRVSVQKLRIAIHVKQIINATHAPLFCATCANPNVILAMLNFAMQIVLMITFLSVHRARESIVLIAAVA